MTLRRYYLDGLRKLRETLKRLLKRNEQQLQPELITLHRKNRYSNPKQ